MTDTDDTTDTEWDAFFEEANKRYLEAFERNVTAQSEFVDAWMTALEESTDRDHLESGMEGYAKAYDVWMEAAEDQVERMTASFEGADVSTEEFRDRWLRAANEAFKEVMSTNAFAAMTGDTVGSALDLKQEADELAEETLHGLGFATVGDVEEVGDRLIELERRQQRIEEHLEEILEELQG